LQDRAIGQEVAIKRKLGIYGAGGHGREVEWAASNGNNFEVVAYIDSNPNVACSFPVMSLGEFSSVYPDALVTVAIGDPKTRARVTQECSGFGFATVVHCDAVLSPSAKLGTGCVVFAGSILSVGVVLGDHVHVNVACSISHDSSIGDYSTLSPGVKVCGNVQIGHSVNIGAGATIINGRPGSPLVIGDCSVIAAGSCVTKSVEANCMFAGVPAVLKKRYQAPILI
jgi:sugar O-acyltransferase (sialic acid O-acetyltransferase NeuD family)